MTIHDNDWTKEDLMGKNVSFKGIAPVAENGGSGSPRKTHSKDTTKIDPMLWGRPGHLSEGEAETYVSFCVCVSRAPLLLLLLLLVVVAVLPPGRSIGEILCDGLC